MAWIAVLHLGSLLVLALCAIRAPELPWHG